MNSTLSVCLLLAALCALAHCHHFPHHPTCEDDHKDPNHMEEYALLNQACVKQGTSYADFTFRFYKQAVLAEADKNVFFSPISIATAFAMLAMGAKSATRTQIFEGMGFSLTEVQEEDIHESFHHHIHMMNCPNNKIQTSMGNALFIATKFKALEKFLQDVKTFYETEYFPTDFHNSKEAEKKINGYVKKKTHGKIPELVSYLDPNTVMVLVNYIYFKASWENPFDPFHTLEEDFLVDEKNSVKVSMMRRDTDYESHYDDQLSCWLVQIPYNGNAKALFILPDEGKMKQLEAALLKETVCKWEKLLQKRTINLYIPKFSISGSYDVKLLFEKMGITDVFSSHADLSGIAGTSDLHVSQAIHKAVLNVHENGTEAAGATAIVVTKLLRPSTTIKFNRPFVVMIVDKATLSTMFMGKIVNPTIK
ncbi:serpin A3-1-like [Gopherus flavomarginatus]|uniref:serpin A3-1-like n=1 Tax=Gopherus flavomarginatus TaxID=286002 RepID=UPI0021CBFFFC|nr:serpin A3-1-like [Gopherus flavomarginatus]